MEPIRIAMVSYYLPSGSKIGVGHQVHALANAMVDRGHSVTVFSPCSKSDGARYDTETVELPTHIRTFAFAWRLKKIDFSSFDVLHAHGDDYWLWRQRTKAHIRTMHGSCFAEALNIRGPKDRLRMLLLGISEVISTVVADRTVLVSPPTRRWYPWVRTVIPNGVDRNVFHAGEASLDPTVLFVGTYNRRKRGWLVRREFEKVVRAKLPNAKLIMVCEDAPPGPGVEVTGKVSLERLADIYREAWVFCLPSTYEGFGLPYAEAMSVGLPVVATPNPGARYVLQEGRSGILCTEDRIGSALLGVLEDRAIWARWSQASLARAGDFDMSKIVDSYESVYRDAMDA